MVKVCIISSALPPYYGGAELRAFRHAQRLQSTEIETILIGWERLEYRASEDLLPQHVRPITLNFHGAGTGRLQPRSINTTLHLTEISGRVGAMLFSLRREFDVLHVINAATWFNLIPIPLAKALGKPVILEMTLFGSDDPLKLSRQSQKLTSARQASSRQPLKYQLFCKADAYVSKSFSLSEAYRQAGLSETKLFQIPSGVDTQKFAPPTEHQKRALREKLQLSPEQTIVLFVGGIEERKGVHRLLEAFKVATDQDPKTHLLLVGPTETFDQTYVQKMRDYTVEHNLSDKVTFVSKLAKNVHEYMRAADIFVLPSSREGLSMAILEAMSTGLAVVASDIPEVARSQIQNGKEGLLVSLDNTIQLTQTIMSLIADKAQRCDLGQAARQRVLLEFDQNIIDKQYLQLYQNLLQAKQQ